MAANIDKNDSDECMRGLTFRTQTGSSNQADVGTADVLNLFSAAHSTYGWLGGLDGVKCLLSKFPNTISKTSKELHLDQNLRLSPIEVLVLTAHGPLTCFMDDAQEAFGGDVRTQLIGLTLCALSHEFCETSALNLFKECMLHQLFEGPDEITDALYSQVNDESHIRRILNEGAARGLTQLFTSAIASLNIHEGDRIWLCDNLFVEDDLEALPQEIAMVGGLLRWMMSSDCGTYATRSALAARVAACLRCIGYRVGGIQAWDGTGNSPEDLSPKTILLVLGGSSPTDPLMLDAGGIVGDVSTLHYQCSSVGAMLLRALGNQSAAYPEELQTHFETVYQYIQGNLHVEYGEVETGVTDLEAKFCWGPPSTHYTPIAKRIAAIYFPQSAQVIAPCYNHIATRNLLRLLKNQDRLFGGYDKIPEAVCLFRVVSAAIVISVVGLLDREGFEKSQHSISLELTSSEWLKWMCKLLDPALSSGMEYNKAVSAFAAVHCAQDPEEVWNRTDRAIAWRNGIYAVMPSLLQSIRPSRDAVALRCVDSYWANVRTRKDGSVHSAPTVQTLIEKVHNGNASSSSSLSRPWRGQAQRGPPDVPLYLTMERPLHYTVPDLSFVGRIGGTIIGATGVLDVLRGLVKNLDEQYECPGHTWTPEVFNIKASIWAGNNESKLVGRHTHSFLPVQGDKSWAVFLVGDTTYCRGRIALRCVGCTIERAGSRSVIIGYC